MPEKTRQTLKHSIDRAVDEMERLFAREGSAKDAARLAERYSEEAILMPPGEKLLRGRSAIKKYWQRSLREGPATLAVDRIEIKATDGMGYEVASYRTRREDGEPDVVGKSLTIWRWESGEWKIHRDIWNRSPGSQTSE